MYCNPTPNFGTQTIIYQGSHQHEGGTACMSIQTKKRKINGQEVIYYYPVISTYKYDKSKTPIWGEGFPNIEDARLEEARMKKRLKKSPYAKQLRSTITFQNIRETWLKTRITKEGATQDRDENYCRIYLSVFDEMDIRRITALDIQDWINMLVEKDYAPKTISLAFNLLSQIMEYAINPLHILKDNPCRDNIQRPTPKRRGVTSDKFWTEQELKYFLGHSCTKNDLYNCMYVIHSTFGMRPGEVCGISIYDIDLPAHRLSLNHGVDKKGALTDLKTTGSQRALRIPNRLIPLLEQQIEYSNTFRAPDIDYPYLFVSNSGRQITPDTYCQHLQRLIERINRQSKDFRLKPLTPYGFRHTFATLALQKGTNMKIVADIMGDAVETVMSNYVHVLDQMSADSLEAFADAILD